MGSEKGVKLNLLILSSCLSQTACALGVAMRASVVKKVRFDRFFRAPRTPFSLVSIPMANRMTPR
jgi:hypothetical protein